MRKEVLAEPLRSPPVSAGWQPPHLLHSLVEISTLPLLVTCPQLVASKGGQAWELRVSQLELWSRPAPSLASVDRGGCLHLPLCDPCGFQPVPTAFCLRWGQQILQHLHVPVVYQA